MVHNFNLSHSWLACYSYSLHPPKGEQLYDDDADDDDDDNDDDDDKICFSTRWPPLLHVRVVFRRVLKIKSTKGNTPFKSVNENIKSD